MALALRPPRIRKWTRSNVETVGQYRVFAVERATMIDPDGKPLLGRTFHTIRCSTWCNVVPVTEAGEVVLIWQYRHGSDALSLEIPGGVVDAGEAPIDAARRERREETGYEASAIEPLLVVQPNPALQGNECHTFLARGVRLAGGTHFDEAEECEPVLVPVADLPELLDGGFVHHALVVSALETFLRRERAR
jgi:ADP-ribose pyrophosphatase